MFEEKFGIWAIWLCVIKPNIRENVLVWLSEKDDWDICHIQGLLVDVEHTLLENRSQVWSQQFQVSFLTELEELQTIEQWSEW